MVRMTALDPRTTYLDLAGYGESRAIPVTDTFWPDLMQGKLRFEGRMLGSSAVDGAWSHWERHPKGEEVLLMLDGEATFECDDGEKTWTVHIPTHQLYVVPANVWHRATAGQGKLLYITPGEGTDHRPA